MNATKIANIVIQKPAITESANSPGDDQSHPDTAAPIAHRINATLTTMWSGATRRLTNQANRPRADGAPAPPRERSG